MNEENEDAEDEDDNAELQPLKKYLILQKLESLKNKMEHYNIDASGLEDFLRFGKNLSYGVTVSITNSFIEFFEKEFNKEKG